ncbi:MAG: cytochrome c peroxidase [Spongiibacter sp.]|nr:cytochrome c peroxidase [Spongiibacter sp.]
MNAVFRLIGTTVALPLCLATMGSYAGSYPLPDATDIEYPDDEAPSQRQIKLGKALFFDPRLSENNNRPCSSCHNPDLGFGDGLKLSEGANGAPLDRHTPSLYNLAWGSTFMWDGRAMSLEEQVMMPIVAKKEMNLQMPVMLNRLIEVPFYRREFIAVFGDPVLSKDSVASALAAYVRSLQVTDTPFDRYIKGDKHALSAEAKRGFELFKGKANCTKCHDGAHFTDDSFRSLGIEGDDPGRGAVIGDASLNHTFKTPGLRNVSLSAPYMHDGSLESLEAVIRFYNEGGGPAKHKDKLVTKLQLSNSEIADLVAFLGSLTQLEAHARPAQP